MNIVMVGDTENRGNWGCRATSSALKGMIREIGQLTGSIDLSQWPGRYGNARTASRYAKRALLEVRTRTERLFGFGPIDCVPRIPEELDSCAKVFIANSRYKKIVDILDQADLILINGEGSLLGESIPGRIGLTIAWAAVTELDKPVAIVNHTADPRSLNMKTMAKQVYAKILCAVFRDPLSYEELGGCCPFGGAYLAPDAIFYHRPTDFRPLEERGHEIGHYGIWPHKWEISSGLPVVCVGGSAAYHRMRRGRYDPTAALEAICSGLMKKYQVILSGAEFADEEIIAPLADRLGVSYLPVGMPLPQTLNILAGCACYVGGRWHPSLMALGSGTPVVSFSSNSLHKSKGLIELFDLRQEHIPALRLHECTDRILELVDTNVRNRHELSKRYRAVGESYSKDCRKNIEMPISLLARE